MKVDEKGAKAKQMSSNLSQESIRVEHTRSLVIFFIAEM